MPFLIASLPIFSGVIPSTLKSSLKFERRFPSFEPISIIKEFFLKLKFFITSLYNSWKLSLSILVVLLVYGYSLGNNIFLSTIVLN